MVQVYILGIAGSPRHGNTDVLVEETLRGAESVGDVQTGFMSLADYNIQPCIGCRRCYPDVEGATRDNLCPGIADDAQKILEGIMEADGLILGSPVFTWNLSAKIKALMERCVVFCPYVGAEVGGLLRNKVVGAAVVAFEKRGGQEHVIHSIWNWAIGLYMIPVGPVPTVDDPLPQASYFGAAADTTDSEWYFDREAITPSQTKEVWRYKLPKEKWYLQSGELNMRTARNLGRNVAYVAKLIKVGSTTVKLPKIPVNREYLLTMKRSEYRYKD
ncbi:MAG: flavodoxin family protein [Candidatus Geothermarchaeales archaeon]